MLYMREDQSYDTGLQDGFVLSYDVLEADFRLPVPSYIMDVLNGYELAPIQLTRNSWRIVVIFFHVCKVRGETPTVELLKSQFNLRSSPQSEDCIY